nr:MAG TPA: hypothetical protein [Caudoviricetes sp.]
MSYPKKFRNRIREGPLPDSLADSLSKKAYYPYSNPFILLIYILFVQFFYIYILTSFFINVIY